MLKEAIRIGGKHMSKKRILALSVILLSAVIAFGICPHGTVLADGTEEDAKAVITKMLRMDSHVTTPKVEFTFQVDKVSLDDDTSQTAKSNMPEITNPTITYSGNEDATIDNGIKSIRKQTGNGTESFLPKCNVVEGFRQTGIYTYKITEKVNTTADMNIRMKWSKAEYEMTVFVVQKLDGTGVYISNVIVQRTVDNDGTDITDVKISNPGADYTENNTRILNDFIFTNDFTRIGGSIPSNPGGSDPGGSNPDTSEKPGTPGASGGTGIDNEPNPGVDRGALKIFKTVSGDMGDKRKGFSFTLTLTKASALEPANASYTGTIKRADGSQSTESFVIGTSKTFTLKHNEYIFFTDIPVGTTFTVTEETDGYEMTQTTISDGKNLTPATQEDVLVGEDYNIVGFNNELEADALTGIIVNNLPFILLIVIAVSGFAVVLISKRHRMKG